MKTLDLATSIPFIRGRLQKTKTVRLESRDPGYNKLASTPHKYRDTNTHIGHSIILPTISSERREIFPVGMVDGGAITTNQVFALHDAPVYYLSLLSSRMHYTWMKAVAKKVQDNPLSSMLIAGGMAISPDASGSQLPMGGSGHTVP
jgi:hypothetical protein